ncbi:hypothetical protein B0F90DRAFT_1811347 [Multifurca ochricompacta]|uniref:PCI domain-containing protein n=1 Tax=Multifurca ochricompacta TaxID=376703 RepID=A0AAD4LZQ6_9AGAM|nr:hypothetical protein B0F90DRAFT_1811347 [Multifurca ochricompacta]
MSKTDAVAIFAEGTFEDQITELAGYISQSRPEPERASYLQSIQQKLVTEEDQTLPSNNIARRREAFSVVLGDVNGLGEGTEREIEGFFNLLYAHLLTLWPIDSPETKKHVSEILPIIATSTAESAIKYRIDELHVLQLSRADVEKWLKEWEITPEEKSTFLKTLVEVFSKAGQPDTAYYYKLAHVRSFDPASQTAQPAALDAIATGLSNPTVFDLDPLFKLDAVIAAKSHPLFALLRIFLNGGLDELHTWQRLDAAQLERKIRLLSLADLGFQNIGQDLPYAQVATLLQVPQLEVERWVIDAIRAGLLTGKLAQPAQTLRVTRATARIFGPQEWDLLVRRLAGWRAGLAVVLESVAAARRRNDAVTTAVAGGVVPGEKQSATSEAVVVGATA